MVLSICGGLCDEAGSIPCASDKTALQVSEGGDCTFPGLSSPVSLTALHKAVKNKSFGSSLHPPTYPKTDPNHSVVTYLAINHVMSMQVWSNLPHIIWVALRECDLTEVNSYLPSGSSSDTISNPRILHPTKCTLL